MTLCQQEPVIARVLDQATAGLHQSLLQARQRPTVDSLRRVLAYNPGNLWRRRVQEKGYSIPVERVDFSAARKSCLAAPFAYSERLSRVSEPERLSIASQKCLRIQQFAMDRLHERIGCRRGISALTVRPYFR